MKTLLIDDLRNGDYTYVARTYKEGLYALKYGLWDIVYFDHDLGSEDESETGYKLMCWLEENPYYLPGRIELVTANSVGRIKMKNLADKMYGEKYDC